MKRLCPGISECSGDTAGTVCIVEELRTLTKHLPGFAYTYRRTPEGNEAFLYVSPGITEIYDVDPEEAKRDLASVRAVFHPDDIDAFKAAIEASARSLSAFHAEFRVHHPAKGELWLESRSTPTLQDDGTILWHGVTLNISKRKRAEAQLADTTARLASLVSTIPDMIWMKDLHGTYLFGNDAYVQFLHTTEEALIGKNDNDFLNTAEADICLQSDLEALKAGKVVLSEETVILPDSGEACTLEIRKVPIYRSSKEVTGILGIARDITERRAQEELLKQKEQEFRTLAENSPDVIVRYDTELRRIYANPAWENINDASVTEVIGLRPTEQSFRVASFAASYEAYLRRVLTTGESEHFDLSWTDDRGAQIFFDQKAVPEYDHYGRISGVLTFARDITERKTIEQRVTHMAHHDSLTGLPNRVYAQKRTEDLIALAKRDNHRVAILFIDLDGFKTVNDTLGHSVGDALLKAVASRLKSCIRAADILCRQGGDEFLLILNKPNESDDINNIIERLQKKFEQPFRISGHNLSLSMSIGIAQYPNDGTTFDALLKNADTAMYKAKELGRDTYCFYSKEMHQNMVEHLQIQSELKRALVAGELMLHYQPQIDLTTHCIKGVEALIRWQHPVEGMIPPMHFIPVAESSGLINPLGQWVIEEACRQAALWHQEGMELSVAVNISSIQFKRGNLDEVVKSALETTGLPPHLLELELTESVIMHDTQHTLLSVQRLNELGVQLSIDDFGTGYSSLAYLKRFAVDKLKIDQSFVRDLLNDQDDAIIVKAIIQMAKSLGLRTIAEGVENSEVLTLLKLFECDEVQGYHFSAPMSAAAFEAYYVTHSMSRYCLDRQPVGTGTGMTAKHIEINKENPQ